MRYILPVIILIGVIAYIVINNQSDQNWTLFVYNGNDKIENVYSDYKSIDDCWDGAVTATNRGKKYFECGLNCGELKKTTKSCEYICKQNDLFECKEELK